MSVAFDASSHNEVVPGTSIDDTHTPVGSDHLIAIASLHTNGAITNVSVTYDGVAMTLVKSASNTRQVYTYKLSGVPAGAKTVHAGWTTSVNASLIVRTYTGVDDTDAGTANTGNSATNSVTVPSVGADDLAIDAAVAAASLTVGGAPQVEEVKVATPTAGASRKTGSGDVTLTWTHTAGIWASVGIRLIAYVAPTATGRMFLVM